MLLYNTAIIPAYDLQVKQMNLEIFLQCFILK